MGAAPSSLGQKDADQSLTLGQANLCFPAEPLTGTGGVRYGDAKPVYWARRGELAKFVSRTGTLG
jgi:hypothetical protein